MKNSWRKDTDSLVDLERHYLYPGNIFTNTEPHVVTTVLGSCISVCLFDKRAGVGGINHYMLPLWNGEGLASPRYGNIAITRLVEKMEALGCSRGRLEAKVFGGGQVLMITRGAINVSERNIILAKDMLGQLRIPIVAIDVGGNTGRRIVMNTGNGKVVMKRLRKQINDIRI
ncbi:MAG: chemotaxis protein CheD [Thermodesulfovibrionales bacterium]|nr:chemotaxis protein CheD [Thermodesulfovibrionales bacterium]